MTGGIAHAAVGRRIRHDHAVADPAQPQAFDRTANAGQLAENTLDQSHFERLFRGCSVCLCLGHDQPTSSSTVLPRFAAMSSGVRILARASIVARTTLMGLREP